ncbi:MAG TPA: F0F1 ATP synthase subunit A [Candidatus Krumholzibacteria bacterium]|nr:F0F1 ATP synthase subunit A [Candidatus Krumholzibacteria bacterium]
MLLAQLTDLIGRTAPLRLISEAAGAAAEGTHEAAHELPNLLTVVTHFMAEGPAKAFIEQWESMIFAFAIAGLLILVAQLAVRNPQMIPGRLQNVVEMAVESLTNFIMGVLGPQGKPYVPFLGSLFIYILAMNLAGTLPFGKSPTSSLNTTLSLALCVFVYVHYIGFTKHGVLGYLKHMAGSPTNTVEWVLAPLMFVIHVIGELSRPVSLSLRLFGNVSGEDVLLFAFCSLGVTALSALHSPVGIPLQTPFILLAFLTSFIQALVFMLLSTVYILLWLPHDDHAEGHH